MKRLIAAFIVSLIFAGTALASHEGPWRMFWGDERAFIGSKPDNPATSGDEQNDLYVNVVDNLNIGAGHFRFGSKDGNYEFESSADVTRIQAYRVGTPNHIVLALQGSRVQVVAKSRIEFVINGKIVTVIDRKGMRNVK